MDKRPTQAELLALLKKNPTSFVHVIVEQLARDEAQRLITEGADENTDWEDVYDDMGGDDLAVINEAAGTLQYEDISFREVYSKGGGEGGGETVVRVWEVVVGAKRKKPTADEKKWKAQAALDKSGEVVALIRGGGYYSSYEGTEWNDDVELVEAHQVITTKYFTAEERKNSTENFVINLAKD